ncbi:hypothetical protein D3C77_551230 [compost metagenome]
MVDVPTAEGCDADGYFVHKKPFGSEQPRQYDFLTVALAKNDQPGKVHLRKRLNSFAHVLVLLAVLIWRHLDRRHHRTPGLIKSQITDILRLNTPQHGGRMRCNESLRVRCFFIIHQYFERRYDTPQIVR